MNNAMSPQNGTSTNNATNPPGGSHVNNGSYMKNLSPRHVLSAEALRLGVDAGWYSTKVSGTFVSGPHPSEAACLSKIKEINPPPVAKKKAT